MEDLQVRKNPFKRVYHFYRQGFREMKLGRKLWAIIIIKLFIMFFVLRLFFFPNFLKQQSSDRDGQSRYVQKELIERGNE
ncbi:DUF4492 domain-containing protein [Porphyromonas pogonae]|uniref:DUF4492 domain-containing protein n=1 Tax=Porphyromonas pogonae TaxID=867595 RepID=UPI002E77821B|nr:DUF4492 domain-containing protein [Porphyromonas pogonae]